MSVHIRPYSDEDWPKLVAAFNRFWSDLVAMDRYDRMQSPPEYGERYCRKLLNQIGANKGVLLWALIGGQEVGLGAAVVETQSEQEQLELGTCRSGRILELFVEAPYRGMGIGRALMDRMEQYLMSEGCNAIKVEVFAPNVGAHRLYHSLGYCDWVVDLFKRLPSGDFISPSSAQSRKTR